MIHFKINAIYLQIYLSKTSNALKPFRDMSRIQFISRSYKDIVNSYFMYNNVKILVTFMSSEIKLNLNGKGRICFYHPQRSRGKVMFSQACVKNSFHRWGMYPPCTGVDTP